MTANSWMPFLRKPVLGLLLTALFLLADGVQACEKLVRRHSDPLVLIRMPSGEYTGPQLEAIKEALRRMGCTARPVSLPWARALRDLQGGELDILPGTHRNVERDAFALFSESESPWSSRNRLFMRRNDTDRLALPNLQALATHRLRLGLQTGVSYGGELKQLITDGQLEVLRAVNRRGLWQMLALGRVDAVVADERASLRELQQLGLDSELQASPISLPEEPSYTAFSRKTTNAAFVRRFDRTLQAMHRDGTLAAIEARFIALMNVPHKH